MTAKPMLHTAEVDPRTHEGVEAFRADFRASWPRSMGATGDDLSHVTALLDEFDLAHFIAEARRNAPESSTTPSDSGMKALVFYLAKQLFEVQKAYEKLANDVTPLVAYSDDLLDLIREADALPGCSED